MVHGLTVALTAFAVWLFSIASSPGYVIAGVLVLVLAIVIRPRLGKRPPEAVPLARLPYLEALVEDVSRGMNARRLHGVVISGEFGASLRTVGWRRRTFLEVGLPLFWALSPQERVAVLAHELAHSVNGDPRRSVYVRSALQTLETWYFLLRPLRGDVGSDESDVTELLTAMVLGPLRAVVVLVWTALLHLVWRNSQRAEYLADELAVGIAGSTAAEAALRTVAELHPLFEETLHHHVVRHRGDGLFDAYKRRLADAASSGALPDPVFRVVLRFDTTHPPEQLRIRFLGARPAPPQVTLSAGASAAIDRELEPFAQRIEAQLLEEYRDRLYA